MPPAALLVPLTGANAALGRSMARAGGLAQGKDGKGLIVADTGGTPEGAAAAARDAIKKGAGLILGPLAAAEVAPVVAVAGSVPVLAFSNDLALRESGAFLLGVTADQAVLPLLNYARSRGVRRVAVLAGTDAWGLQVAAAAKLAAVRGGLDLVTAPAGSALDAFLRGPGAPDALLASGDLVAPARAIGDSGVQLLGAFTGLDAAPATLTQIEGAWLSAPDPAGFRTFADAFEQANGVAPGVIAGLAFDAATIAQTLRKAGSMDRSALLSGRSFDGVCGAVRFRADGSAARAMAILAVTKGNYLLAQPAAA
ncbi:ABC transporter substrate-binding protein [Sphingomonas sp. AP4-R1]|uniref:ABC transporter substrate-binding protein n=1 Tax=Sphingomonas sp. AP4-R1 TaxID=2735134 RepID=UPI003462957F